jgi:hypothetical protein
LRNASEDAAVVFFVGADAELREDARDVRLDGPIAGAACGATSLTLACRDENLARFARRERRDGPLASAADD